MPPDRARNIIKPTLEVLAGIPTVVYGYFALTFMTPVLRTSLGQTRLKSTTRPRQAL